MFQGFAVRGPLTFDHLSLRDFRMPNPEAGYRVLWTEGQSIVEWRDRVRVHAAPRLTAEDVDTAIADPIELGSARSRLDATFGGLEPVGTWTEIKLDETTETQLRALGYLR